MVSHLLSLSPHGLFFSHQPERFYKDIYRRVFLFHWNPAMKWLSLSIRIKAKVLQVTYKAFHDLATSVLISYPFVLSAAATLASLAFPECSRHTPASGFWSPSSRYLACSPVDAFLHPPVDAFLHPPSSGVLTDLPSWKHYLKLQAAPNLQEPLFLHILSHDLY